MEHQVHQGQDQVQLDVERVFGKILSGEEFEEREIELLRNKDFRRALAERFWWWPHEMKWFI